MINTKEHLADVIERAIEDWRSRNSVYFEMGEDYSAREIALQAAISVENDYYSGPSCGSKVINNPNGSIEIIFS